MTDRTDIQRITAESLGGAVCLNLWAFVDPATSSVLRISGKAYVIPGDTDHQGTILKALAPTDHLTAQWEQVPEILSLITPDGVTITATSAEGVQQHFTDVFGPLIERLHELPSQLCSIAGQYREFIPTGTQEVNYLLTFVAEEEDGRLVPQVPAGSPA